MLDHHWWRLRLHISATIKGMKIAVAHHKQKNQNINKLQSVTQRRKENGKKKPNITTEIKRRNAKKKHHTKLKIEYR